MNSLRQHIQIAKVDVHKSPIEKLKSNIDARAHQVTDTLATRNQVPPEALITLGEYQIISQEWLSKQTPLDGFFEEGQKLNPSKNETDDTKKQCWFDKGIYRYNQLGSDWTLRQLGANTTEYPTIIELYKAAPGENNAEKMKNMEVVTTGWRFSGDGRIVHAGFAYLLSRSGYRNGNMLAARLHPAGSSFDYSGVRPRAGLVPFGVMDKKDSV